MRTVGIPLFDAADRPSVTKPSFASATAGRCKSSTDIASCTRNLVHEPQSATASTPASTLLTQASNLALPSVRISGMLCPVHLYQEVVALGIRSSNSFSNALKDKYAARFSLRNRPIFLPAKNFLPGGGGPPPTRRGGGHSAPDRNPIV